MAFEWKVGLQAPVEATGPISLSDIVRYAGASGDFNPIHHDPDLARTLGNPHVFVMGMLPGAILGAFATNWLAPLRQRSLDLRFVDRVWTGELLACGGEVVDVRDGGDTVAAKLWLRTADGDLKVSGACVAVSRAPRAREPGY